VKRQSGCGKAREDQRQFSRRWPPMAADKIKDQIGIFHSSFITHRCFSSPRKHTEVEAILPPFFKGGLGGIVVALLGCVEDLDLHDVLLRISTLAVSQSVNRASPTFACCLR
jgi:hypothetical protein